MAAPTPTAASSKWSRAVHLLKHGMQRTLVPQTVPHSVLADAKFVVADMDPSAASRRSGFQSRRLCRLAFLIWNSAWPMHPSLGAPRESQALPSSTPYIPSRFHYRGLYR